MCCSHAGDVTRSVRHASVVESSTVRRVNTLSKTTSACPSVIPATTHPTLNSSASNVTHAASPAAAPRRPTVTPARSLRYTRTSGERAPAGKMSWKSELQIERSVSWLTVRVYVFENGFTVLIYWMNEWMIYEAPCFKAPCSKLKELDCRGAQNPT